MGLLAHLTRKPPELNPPATPEELEWWKSARRPLDRRATYFAAGQTMIMLGLPVALAAVSRPGSFGVLPIVGILAVLGVALRALARVRLEQRHRTPMILGKRLHDDMVNDVGTIPTIASPDPIEPR